MTVTAPEQTQVAARERAIDPADMVPRRMAMIGLFGGPLLAATGIAVMLGAFKATAPVLSRTSPAS
jgi:hypothetical protein